MKVIFMGTPEFSVGTLHALVEAGHEVVLAVTQPDKPKGRGGKYQFTPVKEAAVGYGIPVFQPKRVRNPECIEELKKYEADVIVVIAFGQILPRGILEMTRCGCINVHASLLPKYRGAAPIQWAVINGEKVSGVTTMQMDEGLDTGDMLLKTEVVLDARETGESLHDKLAAAGAKLCVETLKALEEGTLTPEKQPKESPTAYAKMLDKSMGNIDWSLSAQEIERRVRGLNAWPGAYTGWNGKIMKIWDAVVCGEEIKEAGAGTAAAGAGLHDADVGVDEAGAAEAGAEAGTGLHDAEADVAEAGAEPGTVVRVERDAIIVQTGAGLLKVTEVQIPGKKKMDAAAFLRGYQVKAGERFTAC